MCVVFARACNVVLTPVVPPPAERQHPHFRPVESGFRETLRNLRFDCAHAKPDFRVGQKTFSIVPLGPLLFFYDNAQVKGVIKVNVFY